ncbi:MAG: hypothetical protein R3C20_03870 [Planctomycetaceae bacterium]
MPLHLCSRQELAGVSIVELEECLDDLALPGGDDIEDLLQMIRDRIEAIADFEVDPRKVPPVADILQKTGSTLSDIADGNGFRGQ